VALCGAAVGGRCHRLVISTPPLDRFATIDGVGIVHREFAVLNGLMEFCDGFRIFMALMGHVIAEPCVVVDAWAFDDRNDGIVVIGVGGDSRLVADHGLPFLTLAHHEHRISWGRVTYFAKGSGAVPCGWLRLIHGVSFFLSPFFIPANVITPNMTIIYDRILFFQPLYDRM
jgi:hypothetical protein